LSKPAYSNLMKALNEGKFVVTGELEPLKTTDLSSIINAAKTIKEHVIAVNVTDNPTAFAYTSPLVTCYLIQKETGLECVYQMTVRDRNRLAITSDLLAASILGIKNVLALSGDFVNVGDNPQTKPVYDIDSTQLIYLIRKMVDEGVDLAGNKIINPPKFNVGGAANPNAVPLEVEVYKLLRKQNVGVDFLQTQSVYDIERLKRFFELCDSIGIRVPILVGVTPIKGIKMLEWLSKFVPGIHIPDEIQERLRKARAKSKEAFNEENVEIFSELCKEIRKTTRAAGIHLMAIEMEWIIPLIVERAGLK